MWRWFLALVFCTPLMADVSLDSMMSFQEMKQTGVQTLSYTQKKALETWIDEHFVAKDGEKPSHRSQLYLSLNIDSGSKLELSNGKTYEVNPEDRLYTQYWITPFNVTLSTSSNPDYPVKITDLSSGTSISAREISTQEVLKEDRNEVEPRRTPPKTQPSKKQPTPTKKESPPS